MQEVALLTSLAARTTHGNPPEAGAAGSAQNVDAQARGVRAHEEVRTVEDLLPPVAQGRRPGASGKKKKFQGSRGSAFRIQPTPKNVTLEMIRGTDSRPQRFDWKRKISRTQFLGFSVTKCREKNVT